MADDRIRWIDLSRYGLTLHALRLPSGQVALVATGHIAPHAAALTALGFRRTRQGHIVHPEPILKLRDVQRHFPDAQVRDLARETVVRIVPIPAQPAAPATEQTGQKPDHFVHHTTWLGVNRRGQDVFQDGAENRYLEGPPLWNAFWDDAPLTASDYLRAATPAHLPEVMAGLLFRADRNEKLTVDDLRHLARVIEAPWRTDADEPFLHELQEALEAATVRYFRHPHRQPNTLDLEIDAPPPTLDFQAAVRLSRHLPPAVARTGRTLAWAQFSTPLPLAVAARTLLGPLGAGRSLLEPTAGHGALLLGLPPDLRLTAVEIDPGRAQRLEQILVDAEQSSDPSAPATVDRSSVTRVQIGDILRLPPAEQSYDYILANPPYGGLDAQRIANGNATRVSLGNVSFPTRRLDHLILLETLKQRHPLGRAVYLIGADHPRQHALDTPAGGSRYLLNLLGDHYHVEAVIGVHGDLYSAQGAHYPLRLVVVGQQGAGFPPVPERTPVARTWDELWTHVAILASQCGPSALERAAPVTVRMPPDETATANAPLLETNPADEEPNVGVVFQERYVARSQLGEARTMIPANMAASTRRALDRIETLQGRDIDDYVGRTLGLRADELAQRFAPEQIDALALVFQAQDRGRGFIEADETGIGKGRVLAGVSLRAWREGRP
ncbi:MAG TPA: hypothetical protein P5330_09015, partial [Candidatus Competibacteraceae bacterium]|nr:hypothetical protein [Candidatus Competibacteraceae bacterium]